MSRRGTLAGGAAELPAETTGGLIEPGDFGSTIEALRGGVTDLGVERALAEIDGWEQRLEESGDPQLMPIAENLRQLRIQLTDDGIDPAETGRLLDTLGDQVRDLASGGIGEPVADKLRQLGEQLSNQGREISGRRSPQTDEARTPPVGSAAPPALRGARRSVSSEKKNGGSAVVCPG